jgi:hypothetical protein
VIYPRYVDRVRAFVAERDKINPSFSETPALRAFQVDNLPREISIQNIETALAFFSLLGLGLYLRKPRPETSQQFALLAINFLPVIFFFSRYVPNEPVDYWERLIAGGSEQRNVAAIVNPQHLRLLEKPMSLNDMLFPNDMGHLQQIHTVHGSSALQPPSLYNWPAGLESPSQPIADYIYVSEERGRPTGELRQLTSDGSSRFQCSRRKVTLLGESLNSVTLSITPGPEDKLLRTDTYYPGWQARLDGKPVPVIRSKLPVSTIQLPQSDTVSTVTYKYRPTFLAPTILIASASFIFVALALAFGGTKLISPERVNR